MGEGSEPGRLGTGVRGPEYKTKASGRRVRTRKDIVVGRHDGRWRTHAQPEAVKVRARTLQRGPHDPPGHTHLQEMLKLLQMISTALIRRTLPN